MFKFTIKPDDGEQYEVVAGSRDILAFEKAGRGRTLTQLSENPKMDDLYALSFLAAKRQGLFEGPREMWDASVDLDFEEDQAATDPTRTEAGTG